MAKEKQEATPLASMNLKACGCDGKEAIIQKKAVLMGRVFGVCESIKMKAARNGDNYNIILGEFAFTNAQGERFTSSKLMLPGSVQEEIESAYGNAAEGTGVEFAFDIFSQPDAKSSTGYKYAAKRLIETAAASRLQKLMGQVDGGGKKSAE